MATAGVFPAVGFHRERRDEVGLKLGEQTPGTQDVP